eukprot:g51963.t1
MLKSGKTKCVLSCYKKAMCTFLTDLSGAADELSTAAAHSIAKQCRAEALMNVTGDKSAARADTAGDESHFVIFGAS